MNPRTLKHTSWPAKVFIVDDDLFRGKLTVAVNIGAADGSHPIDLVQELPAEFKAVHAHDLDHGPDHSLWNEPGSHYLPAPLTGDESLDALWGDRKPVHVADVSPGAEVELGGDHFGHYGNG